MKFLRLIVCLSVALTCSFAVSAQKNFAKDADAAFANEAYYQAKDLYKKAFPKAPKAAEKARIIFQIAECYRFMTDAKQAEVWYEKAVKSRYPDPIAHFHLASVLKEQGKYAEALKSYNEYNGKVPGDKRGQDGAKACELAQEWKDNPTRYEVNPEVLLNSKQYDFSPTIADKRGKMIYFTSSRDGSTGARIDERTGQNFQDIFQSTRDKKGKWSEPVIVQGEFVNSEHNEGSVTFNKKFNTIYFTRCPLEKNKNLGCDIWYAIKKGQGWGEAIKMDLKSELDEKAADSVSVGHPCIAPDDSYLIFASDMAGGQGGKDLWMVSYDKKAKTWGKPKNLGPTINTKADEMFPYVKEDGMLYFSSNGHLGMGGLDIFMAEATGEKQWGNVQNMKAPINSEAHDYGIIFEKDEDRGFFTSNRAGGKGDDDIYSFRMPPVLYTLQCVVYDKDTRKPVPEARIKVVGTDNATYEVQTDENGGFNFELNGEDRYIKQDVTYSIHVDKQDFLVAKDQISTVGLGESTTFIKEFYIQYASKEVVIELPEVRYAYNRSELQIIQDSVNSEDSLLVLFNTLVNNATIKVELQAHTDHRGGSGYNRKLSQARAQSCVDFLASIGIPPGRMDAKGYGEDKPRPGLAPDDISAMKTKEEREAAHQRNRRTEFVVLSFDHAPVNSYGVLPGYEKVVEEFLKTGKIDKSLIGSGGDAGTGSGE